MIRLIPNSNGEDHAPPRLREYNTCHTPSGPTGGQFCSTTGGPTTAAPLKRAAGAPGRVPGAATGSPAKGEWTVDGERATPVKVKTVEEALALIRKGVVVEVADPKTVHTLLKELGRIANEAKAKGEEAPNYDLCKVTVAGSNLFCVEKVTSKEYPKGLDRIEMPQFSAEARPGSQADQLPRKAGSPFVDATLAFVDHLEAKGIPVGTVESVPAGRLKASQAELVGTTVGGMMTDETYDPGKEPIFISRDNYVLDGHHRWAAVVGRDAADGTLDTSTMRVIRIDAPMSELLFEAKAWTTAFGLVPKAAGKGRKTGLHEANDCHNPAGSPGSTGGEFCSKSEGVVAGMRGAERIAGLSRGVERVVAAMRNLVPVDQPFRPPPQQYRTPYPPLPPGVQARMGQAGEAALTDPKYAGLERSKRAAAGQFDFLQEHHPEVIASARALIAKGKAAYPEFASGIAKMAEVLGFKLHTNPEDEQVAADAGNDYVFVGPIKGVERTSVKSVKYGGDTAHVKDILRGTVAVRDLASLPEVFQHLDAMGEIVYWEDRMSKPEVSGYRDMQVFLRLRKSGLLVEMQVLTKPMNDAKARQGHRLYQQQRALPDGPQKNALNRAMQELYGQAWRASTNVAIGLALLSMLRPPSA